ncbi:10744_t:CDS:1, partial [Acaulospora morrowiae]
MKWDIMIQLILFAYRTARQATTQQTPFMLTYRREARLPAHPSESEDLLNGTFLQRMYELTTK